MTLLPHHDFLGKQARAATQSPVFLAAILPFVAKEAGDE